MIELIRSKSGIHVYRTMDGILKCFDNVSDRREITNYKLLSRLGVPTPRVISMTDDSLLIEDLNTSDTWRLGLESDMHDPVVAILLAEWYRSLHTGGRYAVDEVTYCENDSINLVNFEKIKLRTDTAENPVWNLLSTNFKIIRSAIDGTAKTLTYNDFYYTNMAVKHDKSAVMMFDYNLLGKGYAYADIRNVCSSLSKTAADAFVLAYGELNTDEITLDNVVATLVSLNVACQLETFPPWVKSELTKLHDGSLYHAIKQLINKEPPV